nr:urease accessory protein UreE [Acetobacter sacchari]
MSQRACQPRDLRERFVTFRANEAEGWGFSFTFKPCGVVANHYLAGQLRSPWNDARVRSGRRFEVSLCSSCGGCILTMRCTTILPAGSWDAATAIDVFTADYEGRHRRRMMLDLDSGSRMLLDLEHTHHLKDGDGLKLETGGVVLVSALPEYLLRVTADTAHDLLRVSWHLGNRHLPAAISPDVILIRDDHVIADVIRGLGGKVEAVVGPFDPETGAMPGRSESGQAISGA